MGVCWRKSNQKFVNWLEEQRIIINDIENVYEPIYLSKKDKQHFQQQTHCNVCRIRFKIGQKRTRHHCHKTGRYIGCLCNPCNLNRACSEPKCYVIAHAASRYDGHLIIRELNEFIRHQPGNQQLKIIPRNRERFLCLTFGNFVFIDSYEFLNTSLEKLVLQKKDNDNNLAFPLTHTFAEKDPEKFSLLTKKGIFCYDHLTTMDRIYDTSLPPKEAFYNRLKNTHITDVEYAHALRVWKTFGCETFGDYISIYVASDCTLLADVYESYRDLAIEQLELDPVYHFSAPHYSWQAMLRKTGVELDLITNVDQLNMVTGSSLRGGICSAVLRYSKANMPGMTQYNPDMVHRQIVYLDAVSLYGWAMSQSLPKGNFRWLSSRDIAQFDVRQIDAHAPVGYFLEIDIDYPEELHTKHSDLPLLPEQVKVAPAQWSGYMHRLAAHEDNFPNSPSVKLIPHLGSRRHYVLHYEVLKQCLRLGLILRKIHRVLAFDQSRWLEPYIIFNAEQRRQANSQFAKEQWKLMTNSIFGKTCENIGKRVDIKLVNNRNALMKLARKPNFKDVQIYDQHLAGCEMKPLSVYLNKPAAIGLAILEISKTKLYQMHYEFMQPIFKHHLALNYYDTDSLIYTITEHEDFRKLMTKFIDQFDFSNFHTSSPYYSLHNKAIPGKWKNEIPNDDILEFVALKAKEYCIRLEKEADEKRMKGVPKSVVKHIQFVNYFRALFDPNRDKIPYQFYAIRAKKHELFTTKEKKAAISPWDDKRWICDDGYHTLAYNHYNNACDT